MRHTSYLVLAYLCIIFAYSAAPSFCQEAVSTVTAQGQEAKKDPPKRNADKGNPHGEEFKREMENMRRDLGKMGQEIRVQTRNVGGEARSQPFAILSSARALRLQSRYAEAAALYSQFIAKNLDSPRLFEARFWYAKSLFEDQKWEKAAAAFTEFLKHHPDQRTFSQVAKGDRIHCWKVQPNNAKAVSSLKDALEDHDEDIRIFAALALAENKIPAGRRTLEESVGNPKFGEQCALALWKLGLRPQPKLGQGDAPWVRLVVVKVKTEDDSFEIKIPLTFIRGIEKMMPDEAKIELERARMPKVEALSELAAKAPKGTILFQYKNKERKTFVIISVE
jgi:tetratricopeptide (TPR) repeat protein